MKIIQIQPFYLLWNMIPIIQLFSIDESFLIFKKIISEEIHINYLKYDINIFSQIWKYLMNWRDKIKKKYLKWD